MTTRKFHDIEYPIPGLDTAMNSLRPGANFALGSGKWIEWEHESPPPTWDELDAELNRQKPIWEYYEYERLREKAFPRVTDQLDMLYHDIKSGNIENGLFEIEDMDLDLKHNKIGLSIIYGFEIVTKREKNEKY